MLATLAAEVPNGPQWWFEEEYDGSGGIAYRRKGRVRLYSRNLLVLSGFPQVEAAIGALPGGDLVLDGELVVFDATGVSRFQLLQRRGSGGRTAYPVFDLLEHDGVALLKRPLKERRAALADIVPKRGPLQLSRLLGRNGAKAYALAHGKGWEGVIAKDDTSLYQPRVRSPLWLKR